MPETRLHFYCGCGVILNVAEGSAARAGECPACGKIIIVPDDAFPMPDSLRPAPPVPDLMPVSVPEAAEAPEEPEEVEEITDEMIEQIPGDDAIGEEIERAPALSRPPVIRNGAEPDTSYPEPVDEDLIVETPGQTEIDVEGTIEAAGSEEAAEEPVETTADVDYVEEAAGAVGLDQESEEAEAPDESADLLPDRAGAEVVIDFGRDFGDEFEDEPEDELEDELEEELEGELGEQPEEELVHPSRTTRRIDGSGRRRPISQTPARARTGTAARRTGGTSRRSRRTEADEGRIRARRRRPRGAPRGEEEPSANAALIFAIAAVLAAAVAVAAYVIMG